MSYGNRTLPDSRESGDEANCNCHVQRFDSVRRAEFEATADAISSPLCP